MAGVTGGADRRARGCHQRRHAAGTLSAPELAVRRGADGAGAAAVAARHFRASVNRQAFEHVVKAAADIVNDELVVVGSQAVLGQFPEASDELLQSMEVHVFPRTDPARAIEIDSA